MTKKQRDIRENIKVPEIERRKFKYGVHSLIERWGLHNAFKNKHQKP